TRQVLRDHGIVTVCREAICPNQAECWQNRTATFMIGGDTCTRGCRFCAVATAKNPPPPDPTEPARVAAAARDLGVKFAVITSVDRDDLPDGGAAHWAATLHALRDAIPDVRTETLVPDFRGNTDHLDIVLDAGPDVLSHNLETVPRLYSRIRPGARVEWSLAILKRSAERGFPTKTGLMVGLGETDEELLEYLKQARDVGVQIVTLGQYLRPSRRHAEIARFVSPEAFDELAERVRDLGIPVVTAGPLVRSSYHAHKHAEAFDAWRQSGN
ncbi:MAG: lipoyl synthase, partial [Planctomycetota bacterium]